MGFITVVPSLISLEDRYRVRTANRAKRDVRSESEEELQLGHLLRRPAAVDDRATYVVSDLQLSPSPSVSSHLKVRMYLAIFDISPHFGTEDIYLIFRPAQHVSEQTARKPIQSICD